MKTLKFDYFGNDCRGYVEENGHHISGTVALGKTFDEVRVKVLALLARPAPPAPEVIEP